MNNTASAKPVIYVHAKGRRPADENELTALLELGLPLCSRLDYEGLTKTQNGYDQAGKLIAELAGLFPDRPILFIRAGLQPSKQVLDELSGMLARNDEPLALTLLSNAATNVNPFTGLQAPAEISSHDFAGLVRILAPGQLHTMTAWPDHFALLSARLVAQLKTAKPDGTLMQQLAAVDGALRVSDHMFLHDPSQKVFKPLNLKSYETACPPPFSELSSRLQDWFNAGITEFGPTPGTDQPATLHITHSWGGGVAQWLSSFIETDREHLHFQLRSEGPQAGRGFGQKLSLYLGNELRCPVTSWWLNPSIQSISDTHEGYQEAITGILKRYGIGRVFISSLVGHSLDALRSGSPTLQILHDNFPAWPLLSVDPEPYIQAPGDPDLELALREHGNKQEFPDKDARAWTRIRGAYSDTIKDFGVKIVAPGQSVLEIQSQLDPSFRNLDTKVIPHGLPVLDDLRPILPKPRKDGRMRMLVLGRMQTGKGQQLLLDALPELTRHVQVYLLGTGKSGEAFFGVPGVDVIVEYERDKLASTLETIGPDFAALLSVVPETFSFTLSELQQLHIPVIATRLGNFPSRIEHGRTGWLIEADTQVLVGQVRALCDSPDEIKTVRANLLNMEASTLEEMLEAYDRLCPLPGRVEPFAPFEPGPDQTQKAVAGYQRTMTDIELQEAHEQGNELEKVVEQRTEWALETLKHLKLEQRQRVEWVDKLEAEIAEKQANLELWENEFRMLEASLKSYESHARSMETHYQDLETIYWNLETSYRNLETKYQQLSELNASILASTSWKITRPLRFTRRMISTFMQARAWNPARWPWLISRLASSLSTRGVAGTFGGLRDGNQEQSIEQQATLMPGDEPGNELAQDHKTAGEEESEETPSNGESNAPEAFPETAQPKASIVIPVYNKWSYTADCLTSLLEVKGKYSFEVIVVDDQSSDETGHHLSRIKGLTYLRNEKNLGFVGSCNRGASQARGEYVVFLNNDTQVLKGWLDELIETFDREPLAGLVGSRLVYPDGSLQESGGIIYNDGSGWNYGRDQDAEDPKYHFMRESDYVSGACIALKTEYFHELGAFDERYAPAYYEDTDLAFRVRESGRKVFIQPQSVIIHFEGITSGTDTSSGTKKYQLINQQTFVERWQKALESQPDPVQDPFNGPDIRHASEHRLKGRILFIDARTPEPDRDSGSVRLTNLMQCLRDLGYGVTFFADNRAHAGSYTRDLQRTGIEVLFNPWLTSLHEFFRKRGGDFDYIFISRHYIAINYISMIRQYCHQARFIFDTVDLHYLREQRLAELEQSKTLKRASRLTRHSELRVIKAADATLVVSSVEKEVLSEDAPGEKVHVLSNIHQVPGRDKGYADRKDIYFVGAYQHPPNIDAACWFVNDVWPLIQEQLPGIRFHLIGGKAPERVRALDGDGVIFHGSVDSLDPFLNDCRLAVAPLRYGAGVKGKVNMSMAHGQPVVATPIAAEGMFAEHERELLIAEDAESFANEVVRLYQDEELWNRISDASVKNVEDHFSMAAARDSLIELFDSFENEPDPGF